VCVEIGVVFLSRSEARVLRAEQLSVSREKPEAPRLRDARHAAPVDVPSAGRSAHRGVSDTEGVMEFLILAVVIALVALAVVASVCLAIVVSFAEPFASEFSEVRRLPIVGSIMGVAVSAIVLHRFILKYPEPDAVPEIAIATGRQTEAAPVQIRIRLSA
jgi:hypothetical protein